MFRGLVGPYGGTKESEFKRPVGMAIAAILIACLMILLLIPILFLCGNYIGAVLLVVITMLERFNKTKSDMQKKVLNFTYWIAVTIIAFTVYIGGFPIGWEVGDGLLWVWINNAGSTAFPLWIDTFRWMLVAIIIVIEGVGVLLEARLLTEILFPSLPNSVRAYPGLLARIFPFMKIRNVEKDDVIPEPGSVFPESDEVAPLRYP